MAIISIAQEHATLICCTIALLGSLYALPRVLRYRSRTKDFPPGMHGVDKFEDYYKDE